MGVIRTHTERLEKVIDAGVELRHSMRVKTETKSQIIAKQRETILNQSQMINELEKELKELKLEVGDKRQARQMVLDEKKQDKLLKLSRYKHEVLTLNALVSRMKHYIKQQNGGQMPEGWKWGDE
jgi:Mg2+ and Co2+ transporter CorA